MELLRRPFVACLLPALILLGGAVFHGLAYWPGLLHVDSSIQYGQALSGVWDDWHPPLMAWVWRQFLPIQQGPSPIFLMQLTLYWGGFALLGAWALQQGRALLAISIALCALLPLPLAILGSVVKDAVMAGALLSATGLIALRRQKGNPLFLIIAIALILLAAGLRSNAFLACAPLLVMLMPAAWRASRARLAVASVVTAVLLFATMPIVNKALHVKRSDVALSLIIFDLGGITEKSGVSVFPSLPVADPVKANHNCYTPRFWDHYGWWLPPCGIDFAMVRKAFAQNGESPYVWWARAIISHPIAYAQHRFEHFNINSRFIVRWAIKQPVWNASLTPYAQFKTEPNRVLHLIDRLAFRNVQLPVGWPIWWIAVAAGVAMLAPLLESRGIVIPLALSAFLYGSGYLALSVATEIRYHMWTVMAALIAAVIAADDLRRGGALPRRRLALAALPVVIVTIVGIAARLYLQPGMAPAV